MSRRSLTPRDGRQDRRNAKQADRRPLHRDKYADQRPDPADREMSERLNQLVARFDNGEARHG